MTLFKYCFGLSKRNKTKIVGFYVLSLRLSVVLHVSSFLLLSRSMFLDKSWKPLTALVNNCANSVTSFPVWGNLPCAIREQLWVPRVEGSAGIRTTVTPLLLSKCFQLDYFLFLTRSITLWSKPAAAFQRVAFKNAPVLG